MQQLHFLPCRAFYSETLLDRKHLGQRAKLGVQVGEGELELLRRRAQIIAARHLARGDKSRELPLKRLPSWASGPLREARAKSRNGCPPRLGMLPAKSLSSSISAQRLQAKGCCILVFVKVRLRLYPERGEVVNSEAANLGRTLRLLKTWHQCKGRVSGWQRRVRAWLQFRLTASCLKSGAARIRSA